MDEPRNAIEAATHPDPWPWYARQARGRPVSFDDALGLWIVAGRPAVQEALAHPQLRVRPPAEPVPRGLLGGAAGEVFALLARMNDGGAHARQRPLVEQPLRQLPMAEVARAAADAASALMPVVDANAFLSAVPVRTMAQCIGVPAAALDATVAWVRAFVRGIAPGADAPAIVEAHEAAAALMAQGAALGLPPEEAANRMALMQQSLDATAGLIGHVVLALREGGADAEAAAASPEAMRSYVAEVELRCAPIQNTRRFAAAPLTLQGCAIGEGQGLLVLLASADMGFGAGRHGCPGQSIAIEIAAACAGWVRSAGRLDSYFGRSSGFRPLGNARIPVFAG